MQKKPRSVKAAKLYIDTEALDDRDEKVLAPERDDVAVISDDFDSATNDADNLNGTSEEEEKELIEMLHIQMERRRLIEDNCKSSHKRVTRNINPNVLYSTKYQVY